MVTLANLAANVSRAVVHGREVDRPVVGWFTLGSLPLTVLGTWLFTVAAPEVLTRLLGAFLLAVVAWRRLRPSPRNNARPCGSCHWEPASASSTGWCPALAR